jgi:hypothetical protein
MIVKILGVIDIFAAVFFWVFASYGIIPEGIITFFALVILIKGVVFLISKDIASVLDIIAAFIMFASMNFALPFIIPTLVVFYLLQKGIFSLL